MSASRITSNFLKPTAAAVSIEDHGREAGPSAQVSAARSQGGGFDFNYQAKRNQEQIEKSSKLIALRNLRLLGLIKKSLAQGELIEFLRQAWRLNNPSDNASINFSQAVVDFIRPMYERLQPDELKVLNRIDLGNIDFTNQPPRFMLSGSGQANVCSVTYSNPPLIIIDQNIFNAEVEIPILDSEGNTTSPKEKVKLIENSADLACLICHELSHAKLRIELSQGFNNSKIEEAGFYGLPIKFLAANGINPELGQRFINKLAALSREHLAKRNTKSQGKIDWLTLLDDHPAPDSAEMVAKTTLAGIIHNRGSQIYQEAEELNPVIKQHIESFKHISFFEAKKLEHNYQSENPITKVNILTQIVSGLEKDHGYYITAQLNDINAELVKLRTEIVKSNFDIGNKDFIEAVDDLADAFIEKIQDVSTLDDLEALYFIDLFDIAYGRTAALLKGSDKNQQEVLVGNKLKIDLEYTFYCIANPTYINRKGQEQDSLEDACLELYDMLTEKDGLLANQHIRAFMIPRSNNLMPPGPASSERILDLAEKDDLYITVAIALGLDKSYPKFYKILDSKLDTDPKFVFRCLINKNLSIIGKNNPDGKTVQDKNDLCLKLIQKFVSEDLDKNLVAIEKLARAIYGEQNASLGFNPHEELAEISPRLVAILNRISLEVRGSEARRQLVNIFNTKLTENKTRYASDIANYFKSDSGFFRTINIGLEIVQDSHEHLKQDCFAALSRDALLNFALRDAHEILGLELRKEIARDVLDLNCTRQDRRSGELVQANDDSERILKTISFFQGHFYELPTNPASLTQALNNIKPYLPKEDEAESLEYRIALYQSYAMILAKTELDLEDVYKILNLFPSRHRILKQAHVHKLMEAAVTKGFDEYIMNHDPNQAITRLIEFNKSDIVNSQQFDFYLTKIANKFFSNSDSSLKSQLSFLHSVLGQSSIKDPELKARLFDKYADSLRVECGVDNGSKEFLNRLRPEITWLVKSVAAQNQLELLDKILTNVEAQPRLTRLAKDLFYASLTNKATTGHLKEFGILSEGFLEALSKNEKDAELVLDYLTKEHSKTSADSYIKEAGVIQRYMKTSAHIVDISLSGGEQSSVSEDDVVKDQEYDSDSYLSGVEEVEFNEAYDAEFRTNAIGQLELKQEEQDRLITLQQQSRHEIELLHKNFWTYPIALRAVMIERLLLAGKDDNDVDQIYEKALGKMVNNETEHASEIRSLIKSYVSSLHPSQRSLALAAMISASPKSEAEGLRIGEALAFFLETMGPAETKLGQCAESHPKVPKEIRNDLKKLKFKAAPPLRWEIIDQIKELNNQIQDSYNSYAKEQGIKSEDLDEHKRIYIKHIGKILGSGSLFVTVELEMSDGSIQVLALKRRDAKERAQAGFDTLTKMVSKLPDGPMKDTLNELAQSAKSKLEEEVNCMIADEQYALANQLYNGKKIILDDGTEYEFDSAKVTAQGGAFYMMNEIDGDHFSEIIDKNDAQAEKRVKDISKSILTMELSNILQGKFCNDRHGGNVKVNGKIGHFDFKALSLKSWDRSNYDQFAEILLQVVTKANEIKKPDDFIDKFLDIQKSIRDRGEEIKPLVSEIQKALLSLSEYSRNLVPEELKTCLLSAIANGMSDPMKTAVTKQVDKLDLLMKSVVKSFLTTGTILLSKPKLYKISSV